MKRVLSILLMAVMLMSLTACGTEKKEVTKTEEQNNTSNDVSNEDKEDVDKKTSEENNKTETIEITHALGTITIPFNPKRVAVADFGALDTIDYLGVGDSVVALTKKSVPGYLQSYEENEDIVALGAINELNMEALNSSNPDVIIIGRRLKDFYEDLSKIAPVVYIDLDWTRSYMDYGMENILTVAKMFGKEEETQKVIDGYNNRLKAVNEVVTEDGSTALVTLLMSRTLKVLGPKSRCNLISIEAGFENIAIGLDEAVHGDGISYEYIAELNPDYLFVLDRNAAIGSKEFEPAKEQVENELIQTTNAYKNGNIIYISPVVWYMVENGITSTNIMIEEIEEAIL